MMELVSSDTDRVRAHTSEHLQRAIDAETRSRDRGMRERAGADRPAPSRPNREWEIERWLEANASALAFAGAGLAWRDRRWTAFLFQHAVEGWCPPITLFRRIGVRTRREIDAEKCAPKALRGDFAQIASAETAATAVAQYRDSDSARHRDFIAEGPHG